MGLLQLFQFLLLEYVLNAAHFLMGLLVNEGWPLFPLLQQGNFGQPWSLHILFLHTLQWAGFPLHHRDSSIMCIWTRHYKQENRKEDTDKNVCLFQGQTCRWPSDLLIFTLSSVTIMFALGWCCQLNCWQHQVNIFRVSSWSKEKLFFSPSFRNTWICLHRHVQ